MKKVSFIVLGAGQRGNAYAKYAAEHPERMEIVGVAEPIDERRNTFKKKYNVPEENCVLDWTELLNRPKMADCAIISMQDQMHYEPAMKAIELGYHILLEKPMATTPEECMAIGRAAEKKGVHVIVCHVLRYAIFYTALKKLLDDGRIGRVMNIIHTEGVGNVHQSHSFVRGNWHNEGESAPMLLAKSCHDLDILQWLVGKDFKRIQSFGTLSHFCAANRPEGAPDRCIDGCPHADTCFYNAIKLYYDAKNNRWFRTAATNTTENPSDELVEKALRESDYGRCVYAMNNDVVDHQTVNIEFEDDILVTFTMSAFNKGGRSIRVMGTKGEISGQADTGIFSIYDFATKKTTEESCHDVVVDESINGGHGGGDGGIIKGFCDLVADGTVTKSICSALISAQNHVAVFAAEKSRRTGTVVNVKEYQDQL